MKQYNWGILAPGKMAAKFTRGLKLLGNAELAAVGSRDTARAAYFAKAYGFRRFYGSYEELAADPEIDIIYIASPHSFHFEHTMLCLRNGKAVICEKAFALNSHEVETMIEEANKQKLFLMEALWPPFQPVYRKARDIMESGIMGKVVHMSCRFSFQPPYDPADRKFNVDLGGGSLLDIGIYPVIDVLTFMGVPDEVISRATFAPSGSEDSITVIFGYKGGQMANLYSSFRTTAGIGSDIYCEKGNLSFSRGRDMSQRLIISLHGRESEEISLIPEGMGYHFEAIEAMNCLEDGRIQSDIVPHSFSLDLIRTLDRIRESAGIIFQGRDGLQEKQPKG